MISSLRRCFREIAAVDANTPLSLKFSRQIVSSFTGSQKISSDYFVSKNDAMPSKAAASAAVPSPSVAAAKPPNSAAAAAAAAASQSSAQKKAVAVSSGPRVVSMRCGIAQVLASLVKVKH